MVLVCWISWYMETLGKGFNFAGWDGFGHTMVKVHNQGNIETEGGEGKG